MPLKSAKAAEPQSLAEQEQRRRDVSIGNESAPKIITNNTTNLFFNCNQHFGNFKHNSFRVLFDQLASVYFI